MRASGAARFSFTAALCRLPSVCHFRQSSRACLTRQRNSGTNALINAYFGGVRDRPEVSLFLAPGCRLSAPSRPPGCFGRRVARRRLVGRQEIDVISFWKAKPWVALLPAALQQAAAGAPGLS